MLIKIMINKLDNSNLINAEKIWEIFQASYSVEAEILEAVNFPPLNRTISDFIKSPTDFHVLIKNKNMCGLIEIDLKNDSAHIQSLVVYPEHFRQGIAGKLVAYILDYYESDNFTVETGVNNLPAVKLYEKFDFKIIKEWDTDHGVRKVRFQLLV